MIHSASFTSVLRPGAFLMCCAFAPTISNAPSKIERLPIHSRALHGHMGAAFREQPFAQTHQLSRSGAERSHLLLDFPVPANHQQVSHYRGLMYVQSTTPFDQSLHNASSRGNCCATGLVQILSCVLPVCGCDKR